MNVDSANSGLGSVVVMPTYNEALNIDSVVTRLLTLYPGLDVVVVDDNSPDGTGEIVRAMPKFGARLFLLSRPEKNGLGGAYRAGFAWAAARGYDRVVQMDADLSHPPEQVGALLAALEAADLAIGSRYVRGGELVNWPLSRRLISRLGNAYVRIVLRLPVADATAGFRAIRTDLLDRIDVAHSQSNGYCFQIETAWQASRSRAVIVELPICFTDREYGDSKMSARIATEAITQVAMWRMRELFSPTAPRRLASRHA